MSNIKAFPSGLSPYNSDQYAINEGMELRDYFAAKAMQGLIASPRGPKDKNQECTDKYYAEMSYLMADAMLKARKE